MWTRYYMDDASTELSAIIRAARQSPLTMRFINKFARSLMTSGKIRPTDIVPVIAPNRDGERAVYPMRWGFYNPTHKSTLFNARTETAGEKPTFREAWQSRRCIVPASYYFEWEHLKGPDGKTKTGGRYLIQPAGADVTFLGGLYRMEDGFPVFVILTREPVGQLCSIHDRMPLVLPPERIGDWIRPSSDPEGLLQYAVTDMAMERA